MRTYENISTSVALTDFAAAGPALPSFLTRRLLSAALRRGALNRRFELVTIGSVRKSLRTKESDG